jgi:hypothetical protein
VTRYMYGTGMYVGFVEHVGFARYTGYGSELQGTDHPAIRTDQIQTMYLVRQDNKT